MPFANTFRAMLCFPFPGDALGEFVVESVEVRDAPPGDAPPGLSLHAYAVRMVVRGPGGQQGVRRALAGLMEAHPTCFSAYGNPYQLCLGKPTIEPLGERRYAVTAVGGGTRLFLAEELERFLGFLGEGGHLAAPLEGADREALVADYLQGYAAVVRRGVNRYRARVRRLERQGT